MKIEIEAKETIKKTVKAQGSTGRVYLPISWIGKEVIIILPEEDKMRDD